MLATWKKAGAILMVALSGMAAAADGQEADGNVVEQQNSGIQMGGMRVYPAVSFYHKRDDNLFLQRTAGVGSAVDVLQPGVSLEAQRDTHVYSIGYNAEIGRYASSSADNYNDHNLRADADWNFSGKHGLKAHVGYLAAHDPRGSTDRVFGSAPDLWRQKELSGAAAYGSREAIGRIEVEGGAMQRRYQNNRLATEPSDYDSDFIGGAFFYRIYPKTALLLQAKQSKFDYVLPTSTLDSTERRFLFGATWDVAAKTTGFAKIGQLKKDFSSSARQGYSGASWEVAVQWSPFLYSAVTLVANQNPIESTGLGDYILSRAESAAWDHKWSGQWSTRFSLKKRTDDYRGAGVQRQDDINAYGLEVKYQMRRWLAFGASFERTDRASNPDNYSYRRNIAMLAIEAAF